MLCNCSDKVRVYSVYVTVYTLCSYVPEILFFSGRKCSLHLQFGAFALAPTVVT